MSWLAALPVALVAAGWVILPGLALTLAAGLRAVHACAAAPAVSVAVLAVTAVVAEPLGLTWSPFTAVAPALTAAALLLALRRRRASTPDPAAPDRSPDDRYPLLPPALGMLGAVAIGSVVAVRGMGTPETLSQTYDAVFHYSAVARIIESGQASSLTLGTLTDPDAELAFYPAAWHDLVSLLVLSTGASVPVAANLTAIAVATVVWPLSCLLLVRRVLGGGAATMFATPLVAVGFIAFPWSLMTFGVLWPNLLGLALLPAGLAAVVTLCGLSRDRALTNSQAVGLTGVVAAALALAHPSVLFNLAILSVFPALWWLGRRTGGLVRRRRVAPAAALVAAALVGGAALAYLVAFSPLFDAQRDFDWPAYQSPPQAVGEVLLNATNGKEAAWLLSALVVVGLVAAGRSRATRWLIPAHAGSALIFVVATTVDSELATALTGLWYNDSYRLAAVLPVTGVVLAASGLGAVGERAAHAIGTPGRAASLTVAGTAVLVLTTGMYARPHAAFLSTTYTEAGLLTAEQEVFLDRAGNLVGSDAVVAQNPWTGGGLLWALTGDRVLFPHLSGDWTPDQLYLAENLTDAADDERVCAAAERLDVEYLLVGDIGFWPWDGRTDDYPGLDEADTADGFELLAADRHGNALYAVEACGPVPPAQPGPAGTRLDGGD